MSNQPRNVFWFALEFLSIFSNFVGMCKKTNSSYLGQTEIYFSQIKGLTINC